MWEDKTFMRIRFQSASLPSLAAFILLSAPLWAQQPPEKKIPLIVRLSDVSINKIPFIVAFDQGLYDKNGLDVTFIPFSERAARVHGVPDTVARSIRDQAGRAQISIGGGAPGMVSRVNAVEPSDRVILATTDHVVHWPILVRKGSGITKLEDVKGKRIAISSPAACTGVVARIIARHMGWDPEQDVAILQDNYSITPLEKGWADVLIAYEVPYAMGRQRGYEPLDVDLRSWNEPIPCNGVWASKSWAHANKDTVLRFLKSALEAIALMKQDKNYAFQSIAKWYGFNDYEVQNIIYQGAAEMPRKPYPAVEGIKNIMSLYDSNAMRRYKAEDFYDSSFMKELDESGFIDSLYR